MPADRCSGAGVGIDAGTLTLTGSRRRRGQRVKWWPAATLIERLPPRAARGECRELSRAGTDPCLDPTHGLIATAGDALKLAPLPAKHVFPLSVRLRLSVGHASTIEMQIRTRVRVRPPVGRGGEHGGRVVLVSLARRESKRGAERRRYEETRRKGGGGYGVARDLRSASALASCRLSPSW